MKLHKCLLLAAAVTFPLPAYALDLTPDSTRILTDPTYLPLLHGIFAHLDQRRLV